MPTALVTGASSGIGAAFARRLASDGYDLVLVARDGKRLAEIADPLTVSTHVLAADLATDTGIAEVEQRAASVDLLVNNAGFGSSAPFGKAPLDEELRMLTVHCEATLRLTTAAVLGIARQACHARPAPRGHQRVVCGGVHRARQLRRQQGVGGVVQPGRGR